jgi:hypothetical protein
MSCVDHASQLTGLPCFALDVTHERTHASIGVAGYRSDRRRHIEVIDRRPGVDWVVGRMAELAHRWAPLPVVVDPASPAASLLIDLAAAGVPTETLSARDYASACGMLYDAVLAGAVAHLDQPVLNQAATLARRRVVSDAWVWARKVGADISPLVAVTLAQWGLVKAGQGVPQVL